MKKLGLFVFALMLFSSFFASFNNNKVEANSLIPEIDGIEEGIENSGLYVLSDYFFENGEVVIKSAAVPGSGFLFIENVLRVEYNIIDSKGERALGWQTKAVGWLDGTIRLPVDNILDILNGDYTLEGTASPSDIPAGVNLDSPAKNTYYLLVRAYTAYEAVLPIEMLKKPENRGSRNTDLDLVIPIVYSAGGESAFAISGNPGYTVSGSRVTLNINHLESVFHNIKYFHSSTSPAALGSGGEVAPSDFLTAYVNATTNKGTRSLFLGNQTFSEISEEIILNGTPTAGQYTYYLLEDINGNRQVMYIDYGAGQIFYGSGDVVPVYQGEEENPSSKIVQIILMSVGGILFIAVSLLIIQKIVDKKKFV